MLICQIERQQDRLFDVKACHVDGLLLERLDCLHTSLTLKVALTERDQLGLIGLAQELELEEKQGSLAFAA